MEPNRGVLVPNDIEKWEKSEAYQDIIGFLMAMNESIKGKKLSCNCIQSDVVKSLSDLLNKISLWVDEFKPVDQPQRYGNKAFRDFYSKLKENSLSELKEHLPEEHHASVPEIAPYFTEAFGNSIRIDYGTGHELSFIMFLCSLHKIGVLTREDSIATVTVLFKRYLDLCRKLQTVYKMEPAGSQGVWSLDDYQFVPFIWGSSQLIMHPKISPEMFSHENIVQEYAKEYLFLSSVQHIMTVKTGPFAEHSNQLWNISGVHSWSKINQGLFKMYKAEILHKFPIIQHVLFGSILSLNPAKTIRFPPPMNMGAMKAGLGMMSRPSYGTGVTPDAGIMPPGPGMMPPRMGSMSCTGMMPPGIERSPLSTGMMPHSMERMPPCAGMMPTGLGMMPSNTDRMPFMTGRVTPAMQSGLPGTTTGVCVIKKSTEPESALVTHRAQDTNTGIPYSKPDTSTSLSLSRPDTSTSISLPKPGTSTSISVSSPDTCTSISLSKPDSSTSISLSKPDTSTSLSLSKPDTSTSISYSRPDIGSSHPNPDSAVIPDCLPSASGAMITSSSSGSTDVHLTSDTNFDNKLLNTGSKNTGMEET